MAVIRLFSLSNVFCLYIQADATRSCNLFYRHCIKGDADAHDLGRILHNDLLSSIQLFVEERAGKVLRELERKEAGQPLSLHLTIVHLTFEVIARKVQPFP